MEHIEIREHLAIEKFAAAKLAMINPKRDTSGYGYMYATLDQVTSIVDPACAANGIGYFQRQECGMLYTEVYDLERGELIVMDRRELSDGNDQQRGSSETYQRRYALLTVFGLAPEDDDGAATAPSPSAKPRLWAAIQRYAELNGKTPEEVLAGVKARNDWDDTDECYMRIAEELETA